MQDNTSRNILWFLAGLSLGAAVGILGAPKSGTETRRLLASKATSGELYERGRHLAEEAAELFEEGRRLMEQADSVGRSA